MLLQLTLKQLICHIADTWVHITIRKKVKLGDEILHWYLSSLLQLMAFSKLMLIIYCIFLLGKRWNPDGLQCDFKSGKDAMGDTEVKVDRASSPRLCFRNVLDYAKKHTDQAINGATWNPNDKSCWAEIGATSLEDNSRYDPCIFSGM